MRYLYTIFWSIILLLPLFVGANGVDSIALKYAMVEQLKESSPDSALMYLKEIHQANLALGDASKIFKSCRAAGYLCEMNNRLDEAKSFYAEAMSVAEKSLSNEDRWNIYTDWAILHKKLGLFAVAYDFHVRTIDEAKAVLDWKTVENGYHGLGTMYSLMSQFDKSIECYNESIHAAQQYHNEKGILLSKQNISNVFMKAGNLDMASLHIEETYQLAKLQKDTARIAAVLRIYGQIEKAKGNLQGALSKHLEALVWFKHKPNKSIVAETYLGIAVINMELGKMDVAESYFLQFEHLKEYCSNYCKVDYCRQKGKFLLALGKEDEAIMCFEQCAQLTELYGCKEVAKDCHIYLSDIYAKKQDYASAYNQMKLLNVLNDTLALAVKQKIMTETDFKNAVNVRDAEILHQKSRLKEEYSFRRYLIFLTSLLLVLLVFTFKQVREKQKAVRKTELMMQELHHRVKNNLQTIISIMRLQSRQITDKIALEELNDSRTRLEAMALIHQQLYVTDKEETINFRLFIESLIQKYGFTYNLTVEDFHSSIDFDEENIKVDRAIPLGLIANEMIVNSMKYGKNVDVPLQINISLKKRVFCYSDNGSGYAIVPDYDTQLQGFGLRLVASLSEQLKCTYHFFNDNGAHFELRPILSPST